ncbi:MAG: hypothetical protein JXR73_13490 [Candidatus Omnitrophica bacterium]|nr:hypothetical protein [Candidatus Omnitrophota bacterium]
MILSNLRLSVNIAERYPQQGLKLKNPPPTEAVDSSRSRYGVDGNSSIARTYAAAVGRCAAPFWRQ